MEHPIQLILRSRTALAPVGIYSACTANELAIEACIDRAKARGEHVLVEATANQVNQYGGYTGMKPADFASFVCGIADRRGLPRSQVILGGDHLGPLAWTSLAADRAMAEARELVRLFVLAGFAKIHIDTSMRLADDGRDHELDTALIGARAMELTKVAEAAYAELRAQGGITPPPVYVIGSEVPIPGGAQEAEVLEITKPEDMERTIATFRGIFERAGLESAWERVVAIVVQPGVEFGDESIHEYDRRAAAPLTAALKAFPGLVFEGHSTDYQQPIKLRQMVQDGIAILKVGPALTFALREGLFALEAIEVELLKNGSKPLSRFAETLESEMKAHPEHWIKHYRGSEEELGLKRRFSYSDRCRYYLPAPPVQAAVTRLLGNFGGVTIPENLLSQYMPRQYTRVRSGELEKDPRSILKDRVGNCLDDYLFAISGIKSDEDLISVLRRSGL